MLQEKLRPFSRYHGGDNKGGSATTREAPKSILGEILYIITKRIRLGVWEVFFNSPVFCDVVAGIVLD